MILTINLDMHESPVEPKVWGTALIFPPRDSGMTNKGISFPEPVHTGEALAKVYGWLDEKGYRLVRCSESPKSGSDGSVTFEMEVALKAA
ncbi:MAG TPA: hypothetical protein VD862_01550 [Candidatus Paceibacterota bacterium]|nr:hypothetical protein [Candidatus Paceibacterota bacterium]